jgi:hypothetical protein
LPVGHKKAGQLCLLFFYKSFTFKNKKEGKKIKSKKKKRQAGRADVSRDTRKTLNKKVPRHSNVSAKLLKKKLAPPINEISHANLGRYFVFIFYF